MKLAVFSDLHLDTSFGWAPRSAARKRRQALRDTLEEIVTAATNENVDALLCAGDLYEHDAFTPDTVQFVSETLNKLAPIQVLLAPGNHDFIAPGCLYHQANWGPHVHLFVEDRLHPFELANGFTVWGAAHRAPANTDGFLDRFRATREGVNIGLFHGSEQTGLPLEDGRKQPHAPFRADQIWAAGLDHAFCGHFHRPRDEPSYTYPGNPDPLTFGETGDRGLVIATVAADGSVQRRRLRVAQSVVSDVTVDVTGCTNLQAVRELLRDNLRDFRGCVRARIDGELAPTLTMDGQSLTDVAPWLDAVKVVVGNVHVGYDLAAIVAEPTVRGQFVRDVQAAEDLDDAERRRVILTGLRALAGRIDLEVI